VANRAYLYVSDSDGRDDFRMVDHPPESRYYDSRHNVPPAWLFFFASADVQLVAVKAWHQVRLVAPRMEAVERFGRRGPLLRSLLDASVSWHWAEGFARDVAQTEGSNLILDPNEVWQGDDAETAERVRKVLGELDGTPPASPSATAFWRSEVYAPHAGVEQLRLQLLGTTYAGREGSDYGFPDGYPVD
jgi:hypothetical protein